MAKKHIRFIALCLAVLLLASVCGCQPTPDKPAVVGKNNQDMQQQAAEAPYEAPQHWKEDTPITLNDLTVTIDADVSMPSAEKYPVIRVKDKVFTQEEADKIIAVLSEGKQLYSGTIITRADVEHALIEYKKELQHVKDADVSEFGSEEVRQSKIAVYELMIKDAEKQLNSLPKTAVEEPPVTTFQDTDIGKIIRLRADLGKADKAYITLFNGGQWSSSAIITFNNGTLYTAYNTEKHELLNEAGVPKGVKTTKEQAAAQAQSMLEKVGISGMQLALIRPAYRMVDANKVSEDLQGWEVFFTRKVEGIPVMLFRNMQGNELSTNYCSSNKYTSSFYYEQVSFNIDDTGITSMQWSGAMDMQEKLNENAKLLAFGDIQQKIKDQLIYRYAKPIKGKSVATEVHASNIKLEYMRVRVKDTQNDFMLIPVWNVYGYNDATEMISGKQKTNPQNFIETLLTVNAMDGSVIDPYAGY